MEAGDSVSSESLGREAEEVARLQKLEDEVRALQRTLEAETESLNSVKEECELAADDLSEATGERREVERRLLQHQRRDERLHGPSPRPLSIAPTLLNPPATGPCCHWHI